MWGGGRSVTMDKNNTDQKSPSVFRPAILVGVGLLLIGMFIAWRNGPGMDGDKGIGEMGGFLAIIGFAITIVSIITKKS
jgi:hypothetical protein